MRKIFILLFFTIVSLFSGISDVFGLDEFNDEHNFLRCNYSDGNITATFVYNVSENKIAYSLGNQTITYIIHEDGRKNSEPVQNASEMNEWIKENKTCPSHALVINYSGWFLSHTEFYLGNSDDFTSVKLDVCNSSTNAEECFNKGSHVLKWDGFLRQVDSVFSDDERGEEITTEENENLTDEYDALGCSDITESDENYQRCLELEGLIDDEEENIQDAEGSPEMQHLRDQYGSKDIADEKIKITEGCGIISGEVEVDGEMVSLQDILHDILVFIRIAGIILVVILGAIDFVRSVTSFKDDELKKSWGRFLKRIIALACLLLLPTIIEFLLTNIDITGVNEDSIFCDV